MHEETNYDLEERFITADRLISEGQLREAAEMLEDILAEAPDFGKAHNHLGWLYETKFKQYDRAEEHYRLAVKYAPGYAAAYYNYCYCLAALRKHDELEIILGLALKVPGINFATLYNEYGMMREIQGRYDDAIQYFRQHIQNSLDSKTIDTAMESIARCERKKKFMSGADGC